MSVGRYGRWALLMCFCFAVDVAAKPAHHDDSPHKGSGLKPLDDIELGEVSIAIGGLDLSGLLASRATPHRRDRHDRDRGRRHNDRNEAEHLLAILRSIPLPQQFGDPLNPFNLSGGVLPSPLTNLLPVIGLLPMGGLLPGGLIPGLGIDLPGFQVTVEGVRNNSRVLLISDGKHTFVPHHR